MLSEQEFQEKTNKFQKTDTINQNPEFLREAYYSFDGIYEYLESKTWEEKNLTEAQQFNNASVFQNNAEAYFRMGFYETIFFQYSKLLYELWYQQVINFQNKVDKRIHKGTQVHQIAIIYEMQKNYDKTWNYFLAGLVEDTLSNREVTSSQAYRSLRRFNLPKNIIDSVSKKTKSLSNKLNFNPLEVVENLKKDFLVPSYEENEIIDYIMLDEATNLWGKIKEVKRDGK